MVVAYLELSVTFHCGVESDFLGGMFRLKNFESDFHCELSGLYSIYIIYACL